MTATGKGNIPLIYIVGNGHSGSTLLDLVIGSHSQIESVGELVSIAPHAMGAASDERCTCGASYANCEFWSPVIKLAMANLADKSLDLRVTDQQLFAERNVALLQAILQHSGARYVCDSSKIAKRLWTLQECDTIDTFIIHLVRDGRAVGNSYQRAAVRQEKKGELDFDFRYVLRRWRRTNLKIWHKFHENDRYFLIRYEDFCADPRDVLLRLLPKLGLKYEEEMLQFRDTTHHNISGNRMRLLPGQEIRRDLKYVSQLSTWDWWRATAIARKALSHFGYPMLRRHVQSMAQPECGVPATVPAGVTER
ncbi:MAG: sulfotransferase [Planctomycetales bacterium]|nr:sulfotransferase [Planctomycetales bacterium]